MDKKKIITYSILILLLFNSIFLDFTAKNNTNYNSKNSNRAESNNKEKNDLINVISPEISYIHNYEWKYCIGGIPPNSIVYCTSISLDGNYIAAGNGYGGVYFFNKSSSTYLWSRFIGGPGNVNSVYSVELSSNGTYVAAGGAYGDLYFFNKSSNNPLWTYSFSSYIFSVAMSDDGNYIASGDNNGYFCLFNKSSNNPMWEYNTDGGVRSVSMSSNGTYIVVGTDTGYVYLFNKSSSTPIWSYKTGNSAWSVRISADSNYIAVGSRDRHIYLFNKSESQPIWNYSVGDYPKVSISSNGSYIAAGSHNNKIHLFSNLNSEPLWTYVAAGGIQWVSISRDGNFFIAGNSGYLLWKVMYFHKSNSVPYWTAALPSIQNDISGDGRYISVSTSGGDDSIYLYHWTPPDPFVLSTDSLFPNKNGSFTLTWEPSKGSNNYSVYVSNNYINGIDGGQTLLDDDLTETSFSVSGLSSGDYYYIIAAYNNTGYFLSNCVHIYVDRNPGPIELTSTAENPEKDGNFILNWNQSIGAINYSIYMSNHSIVKIKDNGTLLDEGLLDYSYAINNLYSGDYYYVVVAYNQTGMRISNCVHVYVDRNPGPLELTHDAESPADTDGTFHLYWNESLGRDNFSIFKSYYPIIELNGSVEEIDSGIEVLSYLISDLPNGGYYYAVMAFNESGKTLSNDIFVNVFLKPGDINLMSNATDPDFDGIFGLVWNQSLGAINYSIYVSKSYISNIDENCEIIGVNLTETNFSVSGLVSGYYFYVIIAYNSAGNSTSNCIEIFVQIPPGEFNLYSNVVDSDPDGTFDLYWDVSKGSNNYSVYVSNSYITEIDFNCIEISHEIKATTVSVTGLSTGSYYYIVKANNNTGETLSNCINVLVMIPPGLFSLTTDAGNPDSDGTFVLNWTTSLGAKNYSIYVSNETITELNGNVIVIKEGLTNFSYYFFNLPENRYFYIIIAYNNTGYRFSNCIEIIVGSPDIPLGDNGNDDDDDDNDKSISFGIIYLIFIFSSIFSLIILIKRKFSFIKI